MLSYLLIITALIGGLTATPIVFKNVSDCTITEDGILHYHGKHSFTKFDRECLPWNHLQTIYSDIINEPNFFGDPSIKAAKNYCRNPNMNINGPWCFVQNEDVISMEQCAVCQSLEPRPTLPSDLGSFSEVTMADSNNGSFQNLCNTLKQYGEFFREKFRKFIKRIKKVFKNLSSKISDHFNFNT